MIKSFAQFENPFAPAIALLAMLACDIWVAPRSEQAYWAITLVMIGALLFWQRSLRSKYAQFIDGEHGSSDNAPSQSYAYFYAMLIFCLGLLLASIVYLELGLPYFVTALAVCFIRRDVWLMLVIHHRKKLGQSISASI